MSENPHTKKQITVDGVTLAYEEHGEGIPVVFIHGLAATSFSWRPVAQMLSDRCRSICFDLMGFGDSDKPSKENYTYWRQAELILKAIDQLGLARPVLIGHSMGGGVCLAIISILGAEHKDKIARLVLVDTVCYPQRIPSFIRLLRIPILPELILKLFPERWGIEYSARTICNGPMKRESIEEYTRSLQTEGAHAALIATGRNIIPEDIESFIAMYSEIAIPTQIIWGEHDRIIPLDLGRRLAYQIRSSEFCIVENTGHCPQEERPEEVARLIRKGLD